MKLYEQSHSNSPEELIIQQEDMAELVQKALDKGEWFKRVFFDDSELDIWVDRHQMMSVRALAIKYHQSRWHIRDKIRSADNKIRKIRELFQL